MCSENKSGRWRRIVCMNVMEGRKEIDRGIPVRVISVDCHMSRPSLSLSTRTSSRPCSGSCFLGPLISLERCFSFPRVIYSPALGTRNSADGLYRKVSSSRRFHLSEPDLTCSSLVPCITLPHRVHASASSSTRPKAFIVIALSLAAGVSSSQCFNGNFQPSTRRPGSSDSHPQRFSFLSRRQTRAPLFPTQF